MVRIQQTDGSNKHRNPKRWHLKIYSSVKAPDAKEVDWRNASRKSRERAAEEQPNRG